jgi:pyridoxal phosphate enzyme (YggS family)
VTPPLRETLQSVRERIAAACRRVGRAPASVRLVAVSKGMQAERVRALLACGHTLYGENRVQEALAKIAAVGPGAAWHLVGPLQRNKVRHAVGVFELIHSVDSETLAAEIDHRARAQGISQAVLVQLNLAREDTKHGVDEQGLWPLLDALAALEHVELRGLMTIPPPADHAERSRPWFTRLRELQGRAAERLGRALPDLSMGMTDDFEVAVEEGATLVRVGRALFGERPGPAGAPLG